MWSKIGKCAHRRHWHIVVDISECHSQWFKWQHHSLINHSRCSIWPFGQAAADDWIYSQCTKTGIWILSLWFASKTSQLFICSRSYFFKFQRACSLASYLLYMMQMWSWKKSKYGTPRVTKPCGICNLSTQKLQLSRSLNFRLLLILVIQSSIQDLQCVEDLREIFHSAKFCATSNYTISARCD